MKNLLLRLTHNPLWRQLIILASLFAFCGCMPLSLTYWEPAAPGGKLLNSVPGTVGYKDMIEFSFADVKIRFTGGGAWLAIKLLIPEGISASFVSDELELFEDDSSSKIIKFKMFDWNPKTLQPYDISPTDIMQGKNTNIALLGGSRPKIYPAHIEFGGENRVRYSVKLPPLRIGNQIFKIPEVNFTKKEGFGIGPVN